DAAVDGDDLHVLQQGAGAGGLAFLWLGGDDQPHAHPVADVEQAADQGAVVFVGLGDRGKVDHALVVLGARGVVDVDRPVRSFVGLGARGKVDHALVGLGARGVVDVDRPVAGQGQLEGDVLRADVGRAAGAGDLHVRGGGVERPVDVGRAAAA